MDKYSGLIFDFNGVLFWDTHLQEMVWKDFSKLLRGFSFSPKEIFEHVHGKPNQHILEYLLSRPIISEELNTLSDQKESLYRNLCLRNIDAFQLSPGASDVLDFLCQHHIPHTIATASNGDNLDFFFKHLKLDQWFDRSKVVYDSGVSSGKQEMFTKAAQNLNLFPEDCIVIEDSKSGIIAAHNAGIGKIIALGPQDDHDLLKGVTGVSEVITSMHQLELDRFVDKKNY